MAAAVRGREDYRANDLRRLACQARPGGPARRLMALCALGDGQTGAAAAAVGLMDRQTRREWVVRFNAEGPARHTRAGPPAEADAGAKAAGAAPGRGWAGRAGSSSCSLAAPTPSW
jgi:hypothetical protein